MDFSDRFDKILAYSILIFGVLSIAEFARSTELVPRVPAVKPASTIVDREASISHIVVKFLDSEQVRLRDGRLICKSGKRLDDVEKILRPYMETGFRRLFDIFPEEILDLDKIELQEKSGHELADLNGYFRLEIIDPSEAESIINDLHRIAAVEIAYLAPVPQLAGDIDPPTPDYQSVQDYREPAPAGIDADYANLLPGGDGTGIKIVDIEGNWNFHHEDLDKALGGHIAGDLVDDLSWKNHGTAVIGELVAGDNGYGVTGICPGAEIGMVSIGSISFASAVYAAANNSEPGDIMLIELHTPGPHFDFENTLDQRGFVCMEYYQDAFDAFLYAWAKGITVVEAAGNGWENYDDTNIYGQLFDTTYRNSHAIMVGAGGHPTSGMDRERIYFSNFGERVNLQGYGRDVFTTGYGTLFGPDGDENQFYTGTFSGTSSASAIVAGAVACLQGNYMAGHGSILAADAIRDLLVATGSPQLGDTSTHIGPRPDLYAAINGLQPPQLLASPTVFDTVVNEGQTIVTDLWLFNGSGSVGLDFEITADDSVPFRNISDWLQVSPEIGSIPANDSLLISVTMDAIALPSQTDKYSGGLKISWGAGGGPLDSILMVRALLYVACGQPQLCGDADDNGQVNEDDVAFIAEYIADREETPACPLAADCDGKSGITIGDAIHLGEYISQSGAPPNCEASGGYTYSLSATDTLYLPMISNIPIDLDSISLPVMTLFSGAVGGFYFPLLPVADGSDNTFYLERIDTFGHVSLGSGLNLADGSSVAYGVESLDTVEFSGNKELFSLVYNRLQAGSGIIMSDITDRSPEWRYAVEKDGQLYRPTIVYNNLGSSFPQLSESEFYFETTAGLPVNDTFDILITSSGPSISWQAETSESWIALDDYSGTTDQTILVSANSTGVPPGWHTGEITVYAPANPFRLERIVSVILLINPDAAQVINVPADFDSIQQAIDAAAFGDTVLVAPGEYSEAIDFRGKAIKVIGAEGADGTFLSPPDTGLYPQLVKMIDIIPPGAELSGFDISGCDGRGLRAILVENTNEVLISDNIIHNNFLIEGLGSSVIYLDASTATVTGNLFYDNGGTTACIQVNNGSLAIIGHNTIAFCSRGIGCYNTNDMTTVENNLITGMSAWAMWGDMFETDCNNLWNNSADMILGPEPGPNDISVDPLYCCDSKKNFHLQPDSPCLLDGGVCGDRIGALGIDSIDCDCFDVTPFAIDPGVTPINESGYVISQTPDIFWTFFDTAQGTVQQQYIIEIGVDTLWDQAEMWATGPVISTDNFATYDGLTLNDHVTYYFRIRLNNGFNWGDWAQGSFVTRYRSIINVPEDRPTIQGGIDMALSGDTVVVGPGIYNGTILFPDRSIVLVSSDGPEYTTIIAGGDSATVYILEEETGKPSEINGFTLTGGGGAAISGMDNSTRILNNIITGNISSNVEFSGGGISFVFTDSPRIIGNIFYGNVCTAVHGGILSVVSADEGVIISENIFYDNDGPAEISMVIGDPSLVHNNTIIKSSHYGINALGTVIDARNNIVCSAGECAIRVDNSFPGTSIIAEYNCLFDNAQDFNFSPGTGNIFEDPLFVDTTGHDYRLQDGSPCIDAGDPDPAFNDIDGTRNDIGALPRLAAVPVAAYINYGPGTEGDILDTLIPTVYWTYYDTLATSQVKYRIQVGIDDDWALAELWDTGEIESSVEQAEYAGDPLSDHSVFFLRMRVHNGSHWGGWTHSSFATHVSSVLYVPAEFSTIQAGINSARPGDTVLVAAGTYTENVDFQGKAIYVAGFSGRNATWLQPLNPDAATVTITDIEGKGAQLTGFTLSGTNHNHTMYINTADSVIIYDNIFRENIPYDWTTHVVISIWNASVLVKRNTFHDNGGNGCVSLRENVYNAGIINNTFDNNRIGVISVESEGEIINNIITNSEVWGIKSLDLFEASIIDYNDVWNNGYDYVPQELAGDHDISIDPLYSNPGDHDYSLSLGSPCVDAGHPDTIYNDPDGTRADIGALPRYPALPLAININFGDHGIEPYIDTLFPTVYWTYFDTSATIQNRFQIQVGTDNEWSIAEMWDPGEVVSSDTFVVYGGNELTDHTTYYLRIKVRDDAAWGEWNARSFITNASFVCGDANGDFYVDIADAAYLINHIFRGGPAPVPIEAGDANCDNLTNIGDPVYIINYVFKNGDPPCCP